ncbi:Dehydration-responsive element-binding protein 1D [Vitis vinifera]|uniref:Dehydration-responsive element-binding protein 1D n=1 Tax=Vitis vinifera TaxID=29760 RepID=A0A438EJV3_VITVI|nr:Dehydration-responsive element-binding protein 1D [Vitis vinifera]
MNPFECQVTSSFSVESSSSSSFSSSTRAPGSSSQTHEAGSSSQKRKAGRKKFKETRHPLYKGVRQRNGKWLLWLLRRLCFPQFPESVSQLPRAASSSIEDIRSAALKAAQTFEATEKEKEKEREDEDSDPCSQLFVDEEALFNMPTLLDSRRKA